MIKIMLSLVCFGSFLCTGNPWAAVAVIVLGWTGDEVRKAVVAPDPQATQTEAQNRRWQRRQVREYHRETARQLRAGRPMNRIENWLGVPRTTLNPPRDNTPFPIGQPRKSFFSF